MVLNELCWILECLWGDLEEVLCGVYWVFMGVDMGVFHGETFVLRRF